MSKTFLKRVIAALVLLLVLGSAYKIYLVITEADFKDHNFQNIQRLEASGSDTYSFAIVSSAENSGDVFGKRVVPDINEDAQIRFLLSAGGAVLDGAEAKYRVLNKTLKRLDKPSIIGIGKNEISDGGYPRFYKHFGPSYFSFAYGSDYFIFLDSTGATSWDVQESWLLGEFSHAAGSRHIFVVMDQNPLESGGGSGVKYPGGLPGIFSANAVSAVFYSGDVFAKTERGGVDYYACGKAGGVADSMAYGYVRFQVSGDAVAARYVQVAKVFDHPFLRVWVGLWYGIHTLFTVHFANILIVLSALILLSLLAYRAISKEKDFYRDFTVADEPLPETGPLSVAMFTNNYLPFVGGVPISICRLAGALRKRGHRVVVFAPSYPSGGASEEDLIRCPLLNYSDSGKFAFAVANIFSPRIAREFRRIPFDLVHVHHPFWMGKKGLRLGIRQGLPVVLTYHTRLEKYAANLPFGRMFFQNYLSHRMTRRFAQKCDGIIAPTKTVKEYLENIGVSRPKLVLPTGIDLGMFDETARAEGRRLREGFVQGDELLLCSVFRLSPEKNPDFLLEGLRLVKESCARPFKCLLIGEGPERKSIEDKIKALGLGDNVLLLGGLDPERIPAYCLASDLFVFSSQSETQGLVLLEAMAGGCPVVCIRSSGTDDVIVDGQNGYKTQPDSREWAARVRLLMEDDGLRETMAVQARYDAAQYSLDNLAAELESFYRILIAQKRKPTQ